MGNSSETETELRNLRQSVDTIARNIPSSPEKVKKYRVGSLAWRVAMKADKLAKKADLIAKRAAAKVHKRKRR